MEPHGGMCQVGLMGRCLGKGVGRGACGQASVSKALGALTRPRVLTVGLSA